MKNRLSKNLTGLVLVACAVWAADAGAQAPETNPTNQPLEILSDSSWAELKAGKIFYSGNVKATDPGKMLLQCEYLTIYKPLTSGVERIVAETNIVLHLTDPQTKGTVARGQKAVFNVTNSLLELTGDPTVDSSEMAMSAEVIVLDRRNNTLEGRGRTKTRFKANLLDTNRPAAGILPLGNVQPEKRSP